MASTGAGSGAVSTAAQQQQQQHDDTLPDPIPADKRRLFVDVQIENERYLRDHPEIHALFSAVTRRILLNRPHDVVEYATNLFSSDEVKDLVNDVK